MTIPVLDLNFDELKMALAGLGQPVYRADQVADWVYRKGVTDPAKMTNLPPALAGQLVVATSKVAQRLDSTDGTIKLLLELADGERIETVLIPTQSRATACLSTQAGCGMGCSFCASGLGGLRRGLKSSEMLEQILHLQQAADRKVTHVVFMGTGEPLANYDETLAAVRAIIDPQRLNISARRVTVSTVGLPKQIRRLAGEDLPITLAISLHAPNDALRRQIMPQAARADIEDILRAAEEFFHSRNREITLEYVVLAGVNDTNVCAEALARIAARLRCNVNLIQYNPMPEPIAAAESAAAPDEFTRLVKYHCPTNEAMQEFAARLSKRGVNVQVRRSRGLDAAAACGQLRAQAGRNGRSDAEAQRKIEREGPEGDD